MFKPVDPTLLSEYIIENIRSWRRRNRWRQADLDEHAGLLANCTARIERRAQHVTPELLAKIANAFEIAPAILLQETERVHHTPTRGRPRKDAASKSGE